MKIETFYRVAENWTVKNFSSWGLTIKYLQEYAKNNRDMIETIFERGLEITPLTQKAFDKICDTIIEDMKNWNIEDTQAFFENVFEIKEEELETE